jgi:hypothetical protein
VDAGIASAKDGKSVGNVASGMNVNVPQWKKSTRYLSEQGA